jgi:hypothetical protein
MNIEARWLDILKATGPQTTAIAIACLIFLMLPTWGVISPLEAWERHLVVFALLVCGLLAVASVLTAAYTFFPAGRWLSYWINNWRLKHQVAAYIPFMTEKDRKIIAYLLEKNQKQFTGASDGGYAVGLISRGIIEADLRDKQVFRENDVPFHIPDPIWEVMVEHRSEFKYEPEYSEEDGETEVFPWRVHWLVE